MFLGILIFPTYQAEAWSFFGITIGGPDTPSVNISSLKNSQNMALAEAPLTHDLNHVGNIDNNPEVVDDSALSAGLAPDPNASNADVTPTSDQISVYVVHKGDTLSQIAKMFNVSVNTILLSNNLPKNGTIHAGQQLVILPVTGVQYIVKPKDTITKIAAKFNADADEIKAFNDITGSISPGDVIIIPNGIETPTPAQNPVQKAVTKIVSALSPSNGYFIRPVSGQRTQGFHGHNAVDFGLPVGSPVKASAGGTVKITIIGGYNGGYGSFVVIDHPNGMQTLYAHLNSATVSQGQQVSQGQVIGYSGDTGRSTGPHLHFEVHGGVNPFGY